MAKPIWFKKLPWETIQRVASSAGILPELIAAFVFAESDGNPDAKRFEAKFKYLIDVHDHAARLGISPEEEQKEQATSYGLMQIMGATARWLGFRDHMEKLCDPETGLVWGCLYVTRLLNRYHNLSDAIASYNEGSPRKDTDGKYFNQSYVDKVMGAFNDLQKKE